MYTFYAIASIRLVYYPICARIVSGALRPLYGGGIPDIFAGLINAPYMLLQLYIKVPVYGTP